MSLFSYTARTLEAMLWKCWRVRKHHWIRTLVEIAAPILLVLLLVSVNAVMEPTDYIDDTSKPIYFIAYDMKYLTRQLCRFSCTTADQVKVLAYAPNNSSSHGLVNLVMTLVEATLTENGVDVVIRGFESEAELEAFHSMLGVNKGYDDTMTVPKKTLIIAAVVFVNHPQMPDSPSGELVYKLRLINDKFITGKLFADMEYPGPGKHYRLYETQGFLGLQMAVDMAFIETIHGFNLTQKIEMQAYQYPPYKHQDKTHYTMVLSRILPAALVIGFSYMVTSSITEIVKERESGVRKFLKMMVGLSKPGYWLSCMINFSAPALLALLIITLMLTLDIDGDGAVLMYSSAFVVLIFLICYLFAAAWFILFIATMFRTSGMANSLGVIAWTGSFVVPALLIGNQQKYLGSQLMASVLPNMCLYWGFHTIANWEANVVGLHWHNLADYPNSMESMNMSLIFIELLFTGFFYMTLVMFMRHDTSNQKRLKNPFALLYDALYDDTKFPEFIRCLRCGCRCCRTCMRRCRCRKCCKAHHNYEGLSGMDVAESSAVGYLRTKVLKASGLHGVELFNSIRFDPNVFQREDVDKVAGIKIRNVSKSFKGETVVKFMSCDFYENEITVLVGPNGAGKTTLLNVITGTANQYDLIMKKFGKPSFSCKVNALGLDEPDDGMIYVNRYDTRDYPIEVRRSTGLCPQNDMLFDELTVMEHLLLFAWLKCGQWQDAKSEAMRLAQQLDLRTEAKTRSHELTSGQRRKLCLAIAVAGNPKIILLDEATSGLDAEGRKTVWNMLQKIREDRTILVTTHSMEEADILADRIAIMNDGCLKSFGSPQFLKKAYGNEYTLKLRAVASNCEKLVRMILTVLPSAQVNSREITVGGEDVSFVVPDSYASSFPALFSQLYERKDALGILNIDVHRTSMEEVFFGVKEFPEFNNHERPDKKNTENKNGQEMEESEENGEDSEEREAIPNRKLKLPIQLCYFRLKILLRKHFWMGRANMVMTVCQIVLPLVLVLSGITGANRGFRTRDIDHHTAIKMTLDDYSHPVTLYNIAIKQLESAYKKAVGRSAESTRSMDVLRFVTKLGANHRKDYRRRCVVGAQVEKENGTLTAFYNTVPYHSPPLSLNLASNALLKYLAPSRNLSIMVENHPLPNASEETLETLSVEGVNGVVKAFCFYFAYAIAMVCGFAAIRPLREKTSGALHLQLVTGTHPFNFWVSYLIVDVMYILLVSLLVVLVVWIAEESSLYTMNDGAFTLFMIFFVASLAGVTFSYFVIHCIHNPSVGLGWLNLFHVSSGFLSYMIYQSHPGMDDAVSIAYYCLTLPFPVPLIVHTFHTFARICIYNSRCAMVSGKIMDAICEKTGAFMYLPAYGCCPNCGRFNGTCFQPWSYFHKTIGNGGTTIFEDLAILGFVSTIYVALVILIDAGYGQKLERSCFAATSDAFDVRDTLSKNTAEEAEKVRKLVGLGEDAPVSAALLVDGICKNYGNIAAVANVSFSTKFGECFGILGMNGAGKTTVLKILAGQDIPAVGDCYLMPNSLLQERIDYLANISYCPQKDGLLKNLTARQLLTLYGALRGVSPQWLPHECQYWLGAMGLEHDADRMCRDYSGGMQQRLRVAQALIGDPKVIILDEPTTGVDPGGKRHLWTTLQRLQRIGKAIIITSHNVQECEVLCTRIGLMTNGRMRYVERTHELKKMFLHGYVLVLRFKLLKMGNDSVAPDAGVSPAADARQEIESLLGECFLREAHQNMLRYLIPQREQNWGDMFKKLEDIRSNFGDVIESYSITSSSLEEVFLAVAEMDEDSTNILARNQTTCFQSCLLGQCCKDDYA